MITVVEPYGQYCLTDPSIFSPAACDAIIQAEKKQHEEKQKQIELAVNSIKKTLSADQVSGQVLQGNARSSILEESRKWDADLIVCGTHGREGVDRLFWGSVAESVARHAKCSVEIVKHKPTREVKIAHDHELHG